MLNFCPECGIPLSNADKVYAKACRVGHDLEKYLFPPQAPKTAQELVARMGKQEVGPRKKTRQLPTNDEERETAYSSALNNMTKFFTTQGFESYVSDAGTLMVGKGNMLVDAKIVENDGRTAYVTSSPDYDPSKAGSKESKATIIRANKVMKARRLLRVTVNGGGQSVPIYVELRKNITDPELHICKAIMFIFESALDSQSALGQSIRDRKCLRDVPAEWLPGPGAYDELFGLGLTDEAEPRMQDREPFQQNRIPYRSE